MGSFKYCTGATTAAEEPKWPKKQGAITKDGGVEWQTHHIRTDMPEKDSPNPQRERPPEGSRPLLQC